MTNEKIESLKAKVPVGAIFYAVGKGYNVVITGITQIDTGDDALPHVIYRHLENRNHGSVYPIKTFLSKGKFKRNLHAERKKKLKTKTRKEKKQLITNKILIGAE